MSDLRSEKIERLRLSLSNTDWNFPLDILPILSDYEHSFLEFELTGKRTLDNYEKRIRNLGFTDMNSILDAGCGMGQWSLAFAKHNTNVESIDKNISRLLIAKMLSRGNDVENIRFSNSLLEKLEFDDNTFDAVFCYSVIMFTKIPSVLAEFFRVLKPDGKLYIMTDLWAWQFVMIRRSYKNIFPCIYMTTRKFLGYKKNIAFSRQWFVSQMEQAGFKNIQTGADGSLSFNAYPNEITIQTIPFYESKVYGKDVLMEVIATK